VRITDGKTTISKGGVALTGRAIGFLDDESRGSLITTTNPENIESGNYSFLKKGNFAYVFVMTVVGATILLAIERRYRRKVKRS